MEISLILDRVLHNQHVVLPDGLRYVLNLSFVIRSSIGEVYPEPPGPEGFSKCRPE
jgi:hypothetical protein